jgi:hypothetical protein
MGNAVSGLVGALLYVFVFVAVFFGVWGICDLMSAAVHAIARRPR